MKFIAWSNAISFIAILMIIVFSALLFSSVHLNKTSMFCSTTIHTLLPCKNLKFAFLFSSLSLVYAIQDSIILFNSNPHIAILVNAYLCSQNDTCKQSTHKKSFKIFTHYISILNWFSFLLFCYSELTSLLANTFLILSTDIDIVTTHILNTH